jgi:hypothetical protein
MKTKLFAAALAVITLASAGIAAAQDYRRGDYGQPRYDQRGYDQRGDWQRGDWRQRAAITVRKDGRVMVFDRGDRMFYRLLDRPFHFRPGLTYAYTDRCNRNGCVAFVFDGRHRRPIDRIFAPHLRDARGYAWRDNGRFDRSYNRFGSYDRDDRSWNSEDDRLYRDGRDRNDGDWDRDGRSRDGLEGGRRN